MGNKLIYLLIFLIKINHQTLRHVKTNDYYDAVNIEKFVVTLIHQKFCYYSRQAYSLIMRLSENKRFKKLKMNILVLDLSKNDDFKKSEKIKEVPLIYFYYHGVRIKYPMESFNLKNLINFLKIKKNNPFVKKITSASEFEENKSDDGFFVSTILKNKSRLKLFQSGFLKHPNYKFFKIISDTLIDELNLKKESIYYVKKNKENIIYDKAYNHDNYEAWIEYLLFFRINKLETEKNLIDFKTEYNNNLLFVYNNKQEENDINEKIHSIMNLIISKLGIYLCNLQEPICDKVLDLLKLKLNKGLYILKYDNRINHPLIFDLKSENFEVESLKNNINKYFNKELDYFEISEESLNKNLHLKNENLYKVTRKTIAEYFAYLNNHDFVILFTFSKDNERTEKINDIYSDVTQQFDDRDHKIIFSYYFLDLNNHEFIDIKEIGTPFVRVYPYGNMKNYMDFSFMNRSLKNIDNKLRNFLYDNCNETLTESSEL